jgi:hypothetical protein
MPSSVSRWQPALASGRSLRHGGRRGAGGECAGPPKRTRAPRRRVVSGAGETLGPRCRPRVRPGARVESALVRSDGGSGGVPGPQRRRRAGNRPAADRVGAAAGKRPDAHQGALGGRASAHRTGLPPAVAARAQQAEARRAARLAARAVQRAPSATRNAAQLRRRGTRPETPSPAPVASRPPAADVLPPRPSPGWTRPAPAPRRSPAARLRRAPRPGWPPAGLAAAAAP